MYCNYQRYGWLLEKILKTESLTWGNEQFDLSHANKNEQLESCCRPSVDFGAQGIKTMKQSRPVFRSKRTHKSIKRTQKSPNELKFQKVYVWAKWGESSKIDAVCCKTCKMQRLNRYL